MTPYSHERHDLARTLGRTSDHARELHFFLTRKPEFFREMAAQARAGKPVLPAEIERNAKRLKALAADALHSLAEAHALATVFFPDTSNEEAA